MKRRTKKKESFLLARLSLYAVGLASAGFGVAGWVLPELPMDQANLPWAALLLAGFTALSAGVVPFTIEIVGRSWWSVLMIPAALVFGAANAYSFHHGVEALIEKPRIAQHMQAAQARLDTAQSKLDEFPAVQARDCLCPQTKAADLAIWKDQRAPLAEALETAKAEFRTAEASYQPLVSNELVWIISGAIDLSLAFGLAGIALVRSRIEKKAEKSKVRWKRKPKAKPAYGKPRLVASN